VTRNILLTTVEGRLLLVGLVVSGMLMAALGLAWWLVPERTVTYVAMTGLNLFIGRAAGMSFGYVSGLDHIEVLPWNIIVESLQVLVVYPLFALGWNNLLDTSRWAATMSRLQAAAEAQRSTIQRYGIAGLFLFVFTPLWMTGPVVGAIIGLLIGFRPQTILLVVLPATYVAIGVWALLLNELSDWAGAWNHFAPFILVVAVVLITLAGNQIRKLPPD
jgi:uncharacterized membrane protein